MATFFIPLSLQLRLIRKKKKSLLCFSQITNFERKKDKFVITIYCLEKGIYFEKEKKLLISLFYKHGLEYDCKRYGQADWELPEEKRIISFKPTYSCTYIFTFKKKKIDSYFSIY